ncbi:MAG: hypothetical protein RLZZ618_1820, partial [Pseudomonadota bacterium]
LRLRGVVTQASPATAGSAAPKTN